MMKPCLDCGTPTNGNRCPTHQQQRQLQLSRRQTERRKQAGVRSKYGGAHQRVGREVRATATVCWLCNGPANPNDPLQADHIIQGTRGDGGNGGLAAAHRSCNIRRRHLTAQGWTHQRIVERLRLLQHGPPDPNRQPAHHRHTNTPSAPTHQ